jgi:hypothetical protein
MLVAQRMERRSGGGCGVCGTGLGTWGCLLRTIVFIVLVVVFNKRIRYNDILRFNTSAF